MKNKFTISKITNVLGITTKWIWFLFLSFYVLIFVLIPFGSLKTSEGENYVIPLFGSKLLGTIGTMLIVLSFIFIINYLSKIHKYLTLYLEGNINRRKYCTNYYINAFVLFLIMAILLLTVTLSMIILFIIPIIYLILTFKFTMINKSVVEKN